MSFVDLWFMFIRGKYALKVDEINFDIIFYVKTDFPFVSNILLF